MTQVRTTCTLAVPRSSSQTDVMKKLSVILTRTTTIDMTCTANRRQLYSTLLRRRDARYIAYYSRRVTPFSRSTQVVSQFHIDFVVKTWSNVT